jgi:hypothetical protein
MDGDYETTIWNCSKRLKDDIGHLRRRSALTSACTANDWLLRYWCLGFSSFYLSFFNDEIMNAGGR